MTIVTFARGTAAQKLRFHTPAYFVIRNISRLKHQAITAASQISLRSVSLKTDEKFNAFWIGPLTVGRRTNLGFKTALAVVIRRSIRTGDTDHPGRSRTRIGRSTRGNRMNMGWSIWKIVQW